MESFGIACGGLFGLGILVWGMREFLNGWAAANWPTTEGVIVESRIEKDCSGVDARYEPVVKYRYQVADVEFTGERLRFGSINKFGSQSAAERHVSPFPTGTSVTVRYAPENPAHATLMDGVPAFSLLFLMGIGIFFVVLAAIILFWPELLER